MTPQDLKNIELIERSILLIKQFIDFDNTIVALRGLEKETENPHFWDDSDGAVIKMKEKDRLFGLVRPALYLQERLDDMKGMVELADAEGDPGLSEEISADLERLAIESASLQIEAVLSGPQDGANCFVEINAGAGGTEAQDWAFMLARMYSRWAEKKGYTVEITDQNDGDEAGIKSMTLNIKGTKAFGWLKKEAGVHRLVRISPFDSNARRHTSFASVFVSPELDTDIEIEINDHDLRIDTYRASGAGGQHVNKTESAVRITHLPTGVVTQCQTNKSQHRNKDIAMNMLRAKLYAIKLKEQEDNANAAAAGKTDIAWGNQIRSYVLQPYQMVKDTRTGVEKGNAAAVLDGEINEFLEAAVSAIK